MLSAIDRKLVRDLGRMKMQAAAISLVIACGVGAFIMALCTLLSLQQARESYYQQSRFADVFASVKRAPRSLEGRIRDLAGVAMVETRVVADVTLDLPALEDPATGRLISIPDDREAALNALFLRRGRLPERGRGDEVVASEAFVDSHGLNPGDRITAILNGRLQRLSIVGVALSPEYIYTIRPGEILPDDRRFGIFWMRYTALAEAFDMEGAFNDVALTLLPGARQQDVIARLDLMLERYGSGGAYGREDQLSHRYITDELHQLGTMAKVAPTIFLGVAAFLVNMVLSRIIRTQREQIAALKAFGYGNAAVALHYLKLVTILALIGTVLGVLVGWQFGLDMTRLYTAFFRFPVFYFQLDPRIVAGSIVLTLGTASLGALGAVRKAAALPPAEAMRPEPPPEYKPTLVERMGLLRLMAGPSRMIFRKLESHPFRAATTSIGISLGTAVLILGNFSLDAVNEMMDFQFNRSQRQNLTVTLVEPTSASAAFEFQRLPGVLRSEAFRSTPVRLRFGHLQERVAILGLQSEPTLQRVLDTRGNPVELADHGIVLSEKLADLLRVKPGDALLVEVLEGQRQSKEITVAAVVAGYLGVSAYMPIDALNRFLQEGSTVSGAFLAVDPAAQGTLYRTLKETPQVAAVTIKEAAREAFDRILAENIGRMRVINAFFAAVIAFGVVYNAARITMAERTRELATMRVLGFGRGDVSYILLGELAILTLAAIPLGVLFGTGLAYISIANMETESYTVPLVILPSTYAYAILLTLIAAVLSGMLVRRNVDRLDLISVLKNA